MKFTHVVIFCRILYRSYSKNSVPNQPKVINNKLKLPNIPDMFGQFAASTQFYLYGRKHCTKTGWEEHRKKYEKPDILESDINLKDKVYMITGANAGIGREITTYLAKKGATVYMICRSAERANKARDAIISETSNSNVHVMICDCSLESEIRRMWSEFTAHVSSPRLDGLVCNAGLLANEKTLTSEGIEITLALHLLFGTYLLGVLAMPYLESTPGSRMIAVSSGGMYNTKFPSWPDAASYGENKYDGQFAYSYAKRGQVLLMERWTEMHPSVKFVSCHPGWTQTEAVDAAYGDNKKYLQPLRTTWEGAEGIVYLLVVDAPKIEGGAFYLDRE
jgi:dehydrogenase/reductase SDR family protein 12